MIHAHVHGWTVHYMSAPCVLQASLRMGEWIGMLGWVSKKCERFPGPHDSELHGRHGMRIPESLPVCPEAFCHLSVP